MGRGALPRPWAMLMPGLAAGVLLPDVVANAADLLVAGLLLPALWTSVTTAAFPLMF